MEPHLAVLDVGHGNSIVISDTGGIGIIDAAPKDAVINYLDGIGIQHIDLVILSHADSDHIGGLIQLLASKNFTFGEVWLNSDSTKKSALWDDLVYELDQLAKSTELKFNVGIHTQTGHDWVLGSTCLRVLAPSPYLTGKGVGGLDRENRKIRSNSISAVIEISIDDQVLAVLTGDLDDIGLDNLVIDETVGTKILVYPHHGGNPGSADPSEFTEKLLNMFPSENVVFSFGREKYANPLPEIIQAIRNFDGATRIACTELSKHCADNNPGAKRNHLLPVFSKGSVKNDCCSGTIVVKFSDLDTVLPEKAAHEAFIRSHVSTPLCFRGPKVD